MIIYYPNIDIEEKIEVSNRCEKMFPLRFMNIFHLLAFRRCVKFS